MDTKHILANSPAVVGNSGQASSPVGAIVVAAGLARHTTGGGAARGSNERWWTPLAGRPVVAWTVAAILGAAPVEDVVLVVTPDRVEDARALDMRERWQHVTIVPTDGPRRRDAVSAGLRALSPACRWVVVHEATRPLVTPELIAAGLAAAQHTGAAAASEPVKETIKRVVGGVVTETLDRSTLALLQTPQVFERTVLFAAHQQSAPALDAPDDATLAIAAGIRVATFPGGHDNLAIVTPDDLAVAEALLTHGGKHLR